jgi:hypothetical protein
MLIPFCHGFLTAAYNDAAFRGIKGRASKIIAAFCDFCWFVISQMRLHNPIFDNES